MVSSSSGHRLKPFAQALSVLTGGVPSDLARAAPELTKPELKSSGWRTLPKNATKPRNHIGFRVVLNSPHRWGGARTSSLP
ncbi:hypothetical protein EVAR_6988_1 [Eumeta japonica]|uniref:Uncharacterized protein n=1 Tax=Eumeta variegata TaxID=151549 RepID=A0A4C1TGP2_EUMVA|nr:hypothetical protein EVAR_6988_1 [Eumeta japonica]